MSDIGVKQSYADFDEYIRQGEPSQREAAYAWNTAIGLQAVDGLKTSEYLHQTARRHIEGEITIDEVRRLIVNYYESKQVREPDDDGKQEADRVSANIVKILSTKTLDFTAQGFINLHRRIFEGVFKRAGRLRDYDITKREWVLEGDTVSYLNWEDLRRAIEYDMEQERKYDYKSRSQEEMVKHLTEFVSRLWQIHPFGEGNTRTTAVFTIQYLHSLGFNVDNDLFARHSWYFRNALVRANYRNVLKGIAYTPIYLERFFRNLLLGEQWELRNRYLHIHPPVEWSRQPNLATPASTPASTPSSTPASKSKDLIHTDNPLIENLVRTIGNKECSIKEMLEGVGLKDRMNFIEYHLTPSIRDGYVKLLYPDKPRHPRQRYLLTVKGLLLFAQGNGDGR